MVYIINGAPLPLSRPRFSLQNKRIYNPMRNQMLVASIDLQSQHNDKPLFSGPIHVDIIFYLPYPKYITKKKRKVIDYVVTRPDLDNYIKYLLDVASNGILFHDDAIVVSISAKKVYDEQPRTEFSIQSLSGDKSGKKV